MSIKTEKFFVTHITLTTSHVARITNADVSGETLARVRPWVSALVETGQPMPLPVSALADYSAHATAEDGALLVTVSAPSGLPIWTMGVAVRSRHALSLWASLARLSDSSQPRPSAPWAGVVLWPALSAHPDALDWSGDLERCIAWAWCSHDL